MTSKEIVLKLFDRCTPCIMSLTADQENRIIRDLEVLEILKKHLHIRIGTWSDIITCNIDSLTNENYEIIKEWLEEND